jgi:hypothetical protein
MTAWDGVVGAADVVRTSVGTLRDNPFRLGLGRR